MLFTALMDVVVGVHDQSILMEAEKRERRQETF